MNPLAIAGDLPCISVRLRKRRSEKGLENAAVIKPGARVIDICKPWASWIQWEVPRLCTEVPKQQWFIYCGLGEGLGLASRADTI